MKIISKTYIIQWKGSQEFIRLDSQIWKIIGCNDVWTASYLPIIISHWLVCNSFESITSFYFMYNLFTYIAAGMSWFVKPWITVIVLENMRRWVLSQKQNYSMWVLQLNEANPPHADNNLTQMLAIMADIKYLSKCSARQNKMLDFS